MLRIGQLLPSLRTPAFRQSALTVFDFSEYPTHWIALCGLPDAEPTRVAILDHYLEKFLGDGALLLALCPDTATSQPSWLHHPPGIETPMLPDPLSRLRRLLNIPRQPFRDQCVSVLIDPSGYLRMRLAHSLNEYGVNTLRESLLANQRLPLSTVHNPNDSQEKGAFVSCNL